MNAQYTSNVGTWDYSNASAWSGTQPPANGTLADRIDIVSGSTITKSDVGSGDDIDAQGDRGGYSGQIYGTFIIEGDFDHWRGGTFRIYDGGVLEIYGDLDLSSNEEIQIDDGGTLIVHGSLEATGDAYLDLNEGGTIIVYTDLLLEDVTGGGGHELDGTVVVLGDAVIEDVDINANGILVVAGDLTADDYRSDVSGDAGIYVDGLNLGDYGTVVEDFDVLEAEQSGNTDLMDILQDLGLASSIDKPQNFTYSGLSGSSANLIWEENADGDDVIIALYSSDTSGNPVDGTTYTVGETLSDGAEIIFIGDVSSSPFNYTSFVEGASNYVRAWSVHGSAGSEEYSIAYKITVVGLSSDVLFYEDFESGDGAGWELGLRSGNSVDWEVGTAEAYAGNYSAYISTDNGITAGYDNSRRVDYYYYQMDSPVNLSAVDKTYKSAQLSFYWKCVGEEGYDGGSLREVSGGSTTILLSNASMAGEDQWVEEVIDVTDYIGEDFQLAFRWQNNDDDTGESPGLCIDEFRITGSEVARPATFDGNVISPSQVDLSWTTDVGEESNVVIAYSAYGSIGYPESGVTYTAGDYLSGGGKVIYVGNLSEFSHTGDFDGTLRYRIWAVTDAVYSSALSLMVKVPVQLPFSEDFEGDVSLWNFNDGGDNEWVRGKADNNGGTQSAYISTDLGVTSGYTTDVESDTYLELEVDLRYYETASVSFDWKADGIYENGGGPRARHYGEVYFDNYIVSNSNEYRDNTTWQQDQISLTGRIGTIGTLRFRWYNNDNGSPSNPGFCIDNLYVTGTIADPASFSATNYNDIVNELTWEPNTYAQPDEVMIAVSDDGTFGIPEEGVIYEAGDELSGGGTIIYIGDDTSFSHEPLNYGTVYYYKAWSSRNGIYSSGLEDSANTPAKVTILTEDWEDNSDGYPEWTSIYSNIDTYWLLGGTADFSEGTRSSYITNDGTNPGYRRNQDRNAQLSISIDLEDIYSAYLTFDWKSVGENGYDYGEVYLNGTRISDAMEYQGNNSWLSESIDITAFCGIVGLQTLEFRWVNDNNTGSDPGFCVDNIEVGGIYEPTSTIDNGVQVTSSVSSVADTEGEAVSVFSFDLTDKTSQYNDITRVQQLVVSHGAANQIDNWNDAIAGALLFGPDLPVEGMAGTITSSAITFTGTDMILLETQDLAETYSLSVWLNTDLNGAEIYDGDAFDFAVDGSDMVTGLGDDFVKTDLVESGAIAIDVVATELNFTTQPSEYATVNYPISQVPVVSATDENGNVDVDFAEVVTITNSGTIVMNPQGDAAYDLSAVSGIVTYTDMEFANTGTVTLTAEASGVSSAESDEIQIDGYCIPAHTDNNSYIQLVEINTIYNNSGQDSDVYAQYLDQETELTIGVDYDVTVVVYNHTNTRRYAYLWIDWDGSGTFDSDERFEIGDTNANASIVELSNTITVPDDQDAVVGATRMRIQFVENSDPASACVADRGESEDYTVVITTNGWRGLNNVWDVTSNWTSGAVPDNTTDVYIPEHPYYADVYPLITGTIEMNDLEISSGAMVTAQAGSRIQINGDLTAYGDLIVNNSVASPASIIVSGTSTGDATYNWTGVTNMYWWHIGLPVTGVTETDYDDSYGETDYALNRYNSGWERIAGIGGAEGYNFDTDLLEGYSLLVRNADETLTYSGVLNSDNSYDQTYSKADWYLIANPYPSYIDVENAGFDIGDFMETVFIDGYDNTISTYNILTDVGVNGGVRYIAPGQAMWLRTYEASDAISIAKSACLNNTTGSLKSTSAEDNNIFRFTLEGTNNTDESVIIISDDFGSELVSKYDSEKMMNGGNLVNVYSLKESKDISINALPEISSEKIVPIGYTVSSAGMGEFTFEASNIISFMNDVNVYLVDNLEDVTIDLREVPSYTFTPSSAESNNRFELRFEASVTTDVEDNVASVSDKNVLIYAVKQEAKVIVTEKVLQLDDRMIEVYNVSGQLVKQVALNDVETTFTLPQANMVYIINVNAGGDSYQQKVVAH